MKTPKTQTVKLIAFSTVTTKADLDAVLAGLAGLEGRVSTGIRSLGDRVRGWDRWEVRVFFPYSEALAAQDGATVCLDVIELDRLALEAAGRAA